MSATATAVAWRAVKRDRRMALSTKMTLLCLAHLATGKGESVADAEPHIVALTGLSSREVRRSLNDLVSHRMVVLEREGAGLFTAETVRLVME